MAKILVILSVLLLVTIIGAEKLKPIGVIDDMRLIEYNETFRKWVPLKEVETGKECGKEDQYTHGGFIDVTDHPDLSPLGLPADLRQKLANIVYPTKVTHQKEVEAFLSQLSAEQIANNDQQLSAYPTRKYNDRNGLAAAEWIAGQFLYYAQGRNDITVELFPHSWLQSSVIARIQGSGDNADEVIIIGAHEDSISSSTAAPGADDDASGVSCVLEIFRVLATSGFKPSRTIEFHTYSAEEVGLWGSQDIAQTYQSDGIFVYAMIQLDMTMFVKQGVAETIGIISDYVNADLTQFLILIIDNYADIGYTISRCGYGCSDHASWNKAGYNSCFPFEGIMSNSNPKIHTKSDLFSELSPEHGLQFAKTAVGFVVELSY